jgi:hypothetical protein
VNLRGRGSPLPIRQRRQVGQSEADRNNWIARRPFEIGDHGAHRSGGVHEADGRVDPGGFRARVAGSHGALGASLQMLCLRTQMLFQCVHVPFPVHGGKYTLNLPLENKTASNIF